jgi:hypothetical protein
MTKERMVFFWMAVLLGVSFTPACEALGRPVNPYQKVFCTTQGTIPVCRASVEEIATYKSTETKVFQLADNSLVFLIDFADLAVQGEALNRIALFVESRDRKDTVLTGSELAEYFASKGEKPEQFLHGHDYQAGDLARFFNAMEQKKVPLNPRETYVLTVLVENNIIRKEGSAYIPVPPYKVILSIPQSKEGSEIHLSQDLRRSVLRHEASHGEYFTNDEYRSYCRAFWNNLKTREQQICHDELGKLGYDPDNEDLLINELQAFLWEPAKGGYIDIYLIFEGTSLGALRQNFLAGIDGASPQITSFFNSSFTRTCESLFGHST